MFIARLHHHGLYIAVHRTRIRGSKAAKHMPKESDKMHVLIASFTVVSGFIRSCYCMVSPSLLDNDNHNTFDSHSFSQRYDLPP